MISRASHCGGHCFYTVGRRKERKWIEKDLLESHKKWTKRERKTLWRARVCVCVNQRNRRSWMRLFLLISNGLAWYGATQHKRPSKKERERLSGKWWWSEKRASAPQRALFISSFFSLSPFGFSCTRSKQQEEEVEEAFLLLTFFFFFKKYETEQRRRKGRRIEEEEKINTTARHVPITMRESHAPTRPLEEETKQKWKNTRWSREATSSLSLVHHQTAARTAHKRWGSYARPCGYIVRPFSLYSCV